MNFEFINKPFGLLDQKKDRYLLVIVVFVFSGFFINVFTPWNIGRWYSDSEFIKFLRLTSYGLVIAVVLLFTQFPLRAVFRIAAFKLKTYFLWLLIEIILISLVYIFMYGNPLGNFLNDFLYSLKYTVLGILIPYSFALLVIHYRKHKERITKLEDQVTQPSEKRLFAFKDEQGKIKFSVVTKDILLLESTDNYITVFYLLEGKVRRELLRNTMKNLEISFNNSSILRCHRSFMVNTENIELVKKEGKKLQLKIRAIDKPIPVSEKYSSLFLNFLSHPL